MHFAVAFACVPTSGHLDHCFQVEEIFRPEPEPEGTVTVSPEKEVNQENIDSGVELPDGLRHFSSRREDADLCRSMGLGVDDDNELASENAPDVTPPAQTNATLTTTADGLKEDQNWDGQE